MDPKRQQLLDALSERERAAREGGGEARVKRQHAKGKWTARERIDAFLDTASFTELDRFVTHDCRDFGMESQTYLGDGVVTGFGRVDGRLVYVFAQDFTVCLEAHSPRLTHARSARSWILRCRTEPRLWD